MVWDEEVVLKQGGTFTTLLDYFNKRTVKRLPFIEAQTISANGAFALLPYSILPGYIAKGIETLQHNGIMAVPLSGSENGGEVGVASNKYLTDEFGNLLNKVNIRKAGTNQQFFVGTKPVFGFIQCNKYIDDGIQIGDVGSENLQVSFVYQDDNEAYVTTSIVDDVEFQVNIVVLERLRPAIELDDSGDTTYNTTTEGNDKNEVFTQAVANTTWTINHSLNKYAAVQLVDASGNEIEGDVKYNSSSQIVVTFDIAVAGKAYLN